MTEMEKLGAAAKAASVRLATMGEQRKNAMLEAIARALEAGQEKILSANAEDMRNAAEAGMRASLQDRLRLTAERIAGMARGVRDVIALPDPIGTVTEMKTRPNGLVIGRKRVPLGVIGIIYEARPNVTSDAAALCIKAGNAVILRGGKEAFYSNRAIVEAMREAVASVGEDPNCICFVEDTSRDSARALMELTAYLDVLIPRGGAGLIRSVVEQAKVPVIETGVGICHIYVEASADLNMAAAILENAKCSRPSVCNAAECLLVDRAVAARFLPMAAEKMPQVELRGCAESCSILGERARPAEAADYDTEFGDYVLAIQVVDGLEEAIAFIAAHGSGHSEAIVTSNYFAAQQFLDRVDAAAVYVNTSTRFTDGGEFGLGAEIGISTQKLHTRGPMGVEQLTSNKYIIYGSGQIR